MPSLSKRGLRWFEGIILVNTSAIYSLVRTKCRAIKPSIIFSLVKWECMSICFVRWWRTGFWAMLRAKTLSQERVTGFKLETPNSSRRQTNQVTSEVTVPITQYSASQEDLVTVLYFLHCQLTHNYITCDTFLSIQTCPKSKSKPAWRVKESTTFSIIPWPAVVAT